jgi:catechol 2,3-dioxygenase-like lactoylglutathione lyase family enzyme
MAEITRLLTVTVAVADQDEALAWYTEKLGFEKRLDRQGPGFRWLTVGLKGQKDLEILLASWFPDRVGKNAMWVLETPDCRAACEDLRQRGVPIVEEPTQGPHRVEAVIEDLYGNPYELVERRAAPAP